MATTKNQLDPRIISFMTLRKAVGWLGMSLAPAMLIVNYFFSNCSMVQDSISHYYYTVSGSVFVGILFAVAFFLFAYNGLERIDKWSTSIAAFFAICIALFPTNDNSANSCAIVHLPDHELRRIIHYTAAALFFIVLAYISFFLFTKSKGNKTKEKKIRNIIYRTSGIVIIICIALIAFFGLTQNEPYDATTFKSVFWLEWVALIAFGVSWLVKGEIVLKDHSLDK